MFYNDIVTYNQPYFNYSGARIVEPESLGLDSQFGELKIVLAFLVHPVSIDSTIVFLDSSKVQFESSTEQVTTTSATITFADINGSGLIAFNVLDPEADALTSAEVVYVSPTAESEFYTISSVQSS